MRYIVTLLMVCATLTNLIAQSGEITGKVTDENGEGVPFANVSIVEDGVPTGSGTTTDFDGNYTIKPLTPGNYDVKFSYVGFQSVMQTSVLVSSDKSTFLDVKMNSTEQMIDEIVVIEYKVPLIDPGQTSTQQTVTQDDIDVLPTKNIQSIAASTAGVYQEDEGDSELNVKGQRSEGTVYYIDGIKVRGSSAIPATAIEQMTVVTGGVPARYGDATGGIINITTRGAAKQFSGGIEFVTSQFLDDFGYNLASGVLTGPILKNKEKNRTLIGFFLSLEYLRQKDPDPSAIGIWQVKDDKLRELEQNPLILMPTGDRFILASETLTRDDMEKVNAKPNVLDNNYSAVGRLDFRLTDNVNFSLGTNVVYKRYHDWIERYTLLNSQNNPLYTEETYRAFARFTHNIGQKIYTDEDAQGSSSAFQNAYYSLQLDFTRSKQRFEDEDHGDKIWNYGYIGNFETQSAPVYNFGSQTIDGQTYTGTQLIAYQDTAVIFTPGTVNSLGTRFTEQYFDLIDPNMTGTDGFTNNIRQIEANNAIINGQRPGVPHSIWFNTGRQFNGYGYDENDQYRMKVDGAFDILKPGSSTRNKHSIEFGFEFEQRVDRDYQVSPLGLWELARQLTNRHIQNLDSIPILLIDGVQYDYDDPNRPDFGFDDTILYDRLFISDLQTNFDREIRSRLGLDVNGSDIIDIDNLSPDFFNLDMFSADEILNDGSPSAFWYGYDYLGNKLSTQPAFNDFFTKKDEEGNYERGIAAFRPIYTAAYIQDKFHFKDLTFNVGVRVDRFDANQKVLKDQYSLYQIRTANEVADFDGSPVNHPETIGGDYAVYVDDINNPSRVLGYRDGDQWYDSEGNQITDASVVAGSSVSGRIQPYLVNSSDNIKDPEGTGWDPNTTFEDYEPQLTVMPRLQFSFNLTDKALFFAHYDILAQRPTTSRLLTTPDEWLFFVDNIGRFYPNPSLKAQKTIDFQLGFKQKVSNTSAITISAFYREFKDMVQVTRLNFTYPRDNYFTYGNVDFGTAKGFSIDYDMRRTGNLQLRANYSIQFAQGTGSSVTSQQNLVQANQPNLRTIAPLDFDSRHSINVSMDYRYGIGKDYNGPTIKDKQILSNAGINLAVVAQSGTPYTQQSNATAEALRGVAGRPITQGSLNGSRLPWRFRANVKINKAFQVKTGGKKEGSEGKTLDFNIYLQVQNLFGSKNIVNVYRFTGNPDDDGYLDDPVGQQAVNETDDVQRQSFVDLYRSYADRPDHYTIPRTIRLGAEINF